jgi:hypothetical protein
MNEVQNDYITIYNEVKDLVKNNGETKIKFIFQNGTSKTLRLFYSREGNLCYFPKRHRTTGYVLIDEYFYFVKGYEVISDKKDQKFPIDKYIDELTRWSKYVLKHHIPGIWEDLAKKAESVTVPKLVEYKMLYANEVNSEYDAWKKAGEFGLPMIERFKTITLKSAGCPEEYLEMIRKDIDTRKNFYYSWVKGYDVSVEGRQDEDTFRMWLSLEYRHTGNGHYYLLLDYEHAIFAEDD